MCAVRLHAVQTPAKVLLPSFARCAPPVFFVVLHGFLAHSGAMNSFVTMLRNALDAHNHTVLVNNDATSCVLPFHISTLDARNHGLSPHTPTHELHSLAEDLEAYLAYDLPQTVHEVAAHLGVGQLHVYDSGTEATTASQKIRVVGIGHSMGSMTWTHYLMNRSRSSSTSSPVTATDTLSHLDVCGFVSMDMPPVTKSHMSANLVEELVEIIECMKKVDLHRICDLRSAHAEFFRCGMQDIRVRGLCTTNLAFTPDPTKPTRKVASWKCNVPVLEQSIRAGDLFFPDAYLKPSLPSGATPALAQRRREATLAPPSVGEVPVLSILGGASPIGGEGRYGEMWERYAVHLEQRTIPKASHTVYYDNPRETVNLVKHFLTRLRVL